MRNSKILTYTELIAIPDYIGRYNYLRLKERVGDSTFGSDRWLNQKFYTSREWRTFRDDIITRDLGCDLAHPDHEFANGQPIYIHHMNPITVEDINDYSDFLLNPEYVITCSFDTHNAIHYGDVSALLKDELIIRRPNDTSPWRL